MNNFRGSSRLVARQGNHPVLGPQRIFDGGCGPRRIAIPGVMCITNAIHTHEMTMRTNIEIDDKLMRSAMKTGRYKTKRETVEAALKLLIQRKQQQKFLDLAGKVRWEGDLDAWRRD